MRKGPIAIDSLDRPNAPNPNIPRHTGTDYKGLAIVIGIISAAIILIWLFALAITTLTEDYKARDIILWIPFVLIGLAVLLSSIYWVRKIIIFDGLENNTSIFGLNKNKDFIATALHEYAKASATAYHQNVTYGDNTNTTTSTSTNLTNDTPSDSDNTFIEMSTILDTLNKK